MWVVRTTGPGPHPWVVEVLQLCGGPWLDKESPKFMPCPRLWWWLERVWSELEVSSPSGGHQKELEFLWDILRAQQCMRNKAMISPPQRISRFSFSLFPINMNFPIIHINGKSLLRPCQVTDDGNDFQRLVLLLGISPVDFMCLFPSLLLPSAEHSSHGLGREAGMGLGQGVALQVVLSLLSSPDTSPAPSSLKTSIIRTSPKDKQCLGRFIISAAVITCQD